MNAITSIPEAAQKPSSARGYDLAHDIIRTLARNPKRVAGLLKLIEAKTDDISTDYEAAMQVGQADGALRYCFIAWRNRQRNRWGEPLPEAYRMHSWNIAYRWLLMFAEQRGKAHLLTTEETREGLSAVRAILKNQFPTNR